MGGPCRVSRCGDGWALCCSCRDSSPAASRLACLPCFDMQLQAVDRSTTALKRRIPSETPSACHRLASCFPILAVVAWVGDRFAIPRSHGCGLGGRHRVPLVFVVFCMSAAASYEWPCLRCEWGFLSGANGSVRLRHSPSLGILETIWFRQQSVALATTSLHRM